MRACGIDRDGLPPEPSQSDRTARPSVGEVPQGGDALDVLEGLALEVRREAPGRIVGAHLAVPGLVERDHATVRLAPNLGWTDTRPGDRLAASLGLPVQALASTGLLGCDALKSAAHAALPSVELASS